MTKKAKKKSAQKRSGTGSQSAGRARRALWMVWHITGFGEIFKMADDARKGKKGPLSYTKSFVSLSGNSKPCETHHYERLKDLKARPERHLLRSVFEDLKNWAAHKPQHHQGYLVTHAGKPADYNYISAQLDHIDKSDLKKAMKILAQIGLSERGELNGQLQPKQQPKESEDNKDENPESEVEKADCPEDSGNQRNDSGNDAQSFKEVKDNPTGCKNQGKDQGKTSNGHAAVEGEGKKNGNGAKHKANAQDKDKAAGQRQSKGQGAESPPLPSEPRPSDLGGSKVIPFTGPLGSAKPDSSRQRPALDAGAVDYNRSDELFGGRVYAALGLRWAAYSPEGRREICSFASKWSKARASLSGLPPEVVDELGVRLIGEARKIGRRGKRNKRPGAVWCTVVDKLVTARLREAM